MDKIERFLFGKKLSKRDNLFILLLTLGTLGWIPSVSGSSFRDTLWGFSIFALVYVIFGILLYSVIGRIISLAKGRITSLAILWCILFVIVQNFIMLYLYSYVITGSLRNLIITALASFCFAVICASCCLIRKKKS